MVVALGLVAGGVGSMYWSNASSHAPAFHTAPVRRDDLVISITASGTIEPEEVVDVGAQIVGRIKSFGPDPRDGNKSIDHGSPVEVGTVLAQIDAASYDSAVDQARANLKHAEADLIRSRAKLHQAERDWKRAQNLARKEAISATEYDQIQANLEVSRSDLQVGEAAIDQAKAALVQAEINLGNTTIRSPIKGVVLDRRVNVGQTVVSSLNAPSLFLIAKDLTRIQAWASVNEADISSIHPGQAVRFEVDAYPGEAFSGEVAQIRLNASMSQNVVTYTVIVTTDNSGGKLLPYMTANIQFEVACRTHALLVPNAALRWRPSSAQTRPQARRPGAIPGSWQTAQPRDESSAKAGVGPAVQQGILWAVADDGLVRPIPVKTGLSDGIMTEVVEVDLREGAEVVVGEARLDAANTSKLPFLSLRKKEVEN